jgi:hypothetical protein
MMGRSTYSSTPGRLSRSTASTKAIHGPQWEREQSEQWMRIATSLGERKVAQFAGTGYHPAAHRGQGQRTLQAHSGRAKLERA